MLRKRKPPPHLNKKDDFDEGELRSNRQSMSKNIIDEYLLQLLYPKQDQQA